MKETDTFWSQVRIGTGDECWQWNGFVGGHGFGVMPVDRPKYTATTITRVNVRAHIIAYESKHGVIKKGVHVYHSCKNKLCMNPEHLRAGREYHRKKSPAC